MRCPSLHRKQPFLAPGPAYAWANETGEVAADAPPSSGPVTASGVLRIASPLQFLAADIPHQMPAQMADRPAAYSTGATVQQPPEGGAQPDEAGGDGGEPAGRTIDGRRPRFVVGHGFFPFDQWHGRGMLRPQVHLRSRPVMSGKKPLARDLSVGEMAKRSGVAVSTIHFYEAEGLIRGWRTPSNHRRYDRSVLRRVAVIKVAQRLGLPLAKIREAFAALPDGRTPNAKDWQRLSGRWRAELDERIARLTKLRDKLGGCIGCGCLSLKKCPLYNPDDVLGAKGPGPHHLDPR